MGRILIIWDALKIRKTELNVKNNRPQDMAVPSLIRSSASPAGKAWEARWRPLQENGSCLTENQGYFANIRAFLNVAIWKTN